jgi:gliding motility-associated-like protein
LIIITLWYKNQHKKKHLEKLFLVFFLLLNPFIILAENNKWIFTGIKYFAGSSVGIDGKEYTLDPISLISIDTSCYITNTVVDTACGEYLFNANFIDASGSYIDTISSVGGCDTIVTLQLTIFEDSSFTFITACDSAEWNGVWYFNDTIVTDTGFVTTNSFGGSTVTSNGKEGNVWYFGYNAGLDFNSGSPIALTDGQLYTLEGCASISDNNGDLLFYTDGMTVYDRNHIIMSNGTGLLGNNSSSQSGIIVKKPGSVSIYYIFTSDGVSGASGGVAYSEIDMSLNNGFGDVTSIKNVVLFPNACEKITGILHQNGTDFWIVSRLENSNTYHSYLVTNSGINLTPIVTNIGPVYSDLIGYLKSSSNCAMITAANWSTGLVDLFDFDNSTGIISNYVSLNIPGYAYGVEFSENSELLYVSDFTGGNIYQYNLLAGNQNDINNSLVHLGYCTEPGALQLGPDSKIYIAELLSNYLGVIEYPDQIGSSCSYNSSSLYLNGMQSAAGLPTFFSSIFNSSPTGCDSVATAIIDIKNSTSTYAQVVQCDSFIWVLNGQTYFTSIIDTIHSINADSCLHIDSLDLMIYPEINASAIITDELCVNYSDGSIILNVSGGLGSFTYSWSGPNSFSDSAKDIFNLSPGNYNLTITDITSLCIKDTFFVIGAGFEMLISSSLTDVSCYGFDDGTIDINPINLINPIYTWSDILISFEDRINISAGIYYLQIDDNNCFVRDTFIITQPDSLFIISQQTTSVCLGGNTGEISIQTFGGTPGYDYYWSNWNGNSPINSNLSSGIYDLDIYDDNDCLFEETFEILSYQIIVTSVVDNIDCFGGSTGSIDITVSGGFPNYTYLWSDNSINEDIYNLSAGSVTCTINDYLGCENIVSFNLTQAPQLSSIPTVNGVSCYGGSDGSVSLFITGGVSAYNIDWNNADENNLEEGYYPYEITDANACTFNDTVYIPQEDLLMLDIITIDLQCNGDPTGKIDAIVLSGGVYPYTYSWVGPNNFTSNQYIINNLYAGLYTLTVSDANNCDVEIQINLSQPTAVSQDIDFEFSNYSTYGISCLNGSDGWINATPNGGFIPYNYNWSGPNGFVSTNQNINNLSEGMYSVTITNGLGCDEQFSFPMNDPIDALGGVVNSLYDYNGYDVSCYGFNDGGIIVEANGGVSPYTYVWDNVQTLNPLPFQQAGMHLLTMYDNNGCEWESFIVLDQPDLLIWTIEMFPDTCEREVGAIKIELEGGVLPYNYLWDDGQTTFEANQLFEREYNIKVIDNNGCQIFDTIQVSNLVAPKMDFAIMSDYEKLYKQLEDPIVFIDMTELTWQNALYWDWDFGDGTYGTDSIVFHSYQDIGEYDVLLKVTTDYNCIDTIKKKVIIEEYDLFIPNAFTPNSSADNINDEFRPYGFGISEFQMNIYSRWGGLIYRTDNIEDGWNGQFDNSGAEVQLGVYLYYIKTKDVFGALHEYTGEVNLIR